MTLMSSFLKNDYDRWFTEKELDDEEEFCTFI